MTRRLRGIRLAWLAAGLVIGAAARSATPTAKPEAVGLAAARLERVAALMQRHIEGATFAGAVTLIARNDFQAAVMQAIVDK